MSAEKNERPTDKKIDDARKKGQVGVSRDLARLLTLVVVMELALGTEPMWRGAIFSLLNAAVDGIQQPFEHALGIVVTATTVLLVLVFAALFVVCVPLAIAGHWGQFGILISPEAVTPSLDKINPVNGMKQLFSKRKLGELCITMVKAVLIGLIVFILVRDELPTILLLSGGEPKDIYYGFIALLRSIFHICVGVCLVLAAIDFAMQKHFHLKSLYMDMEEIKREYRESEGDPLIKGERRQLARQLAMSGPVARTQSANAVVVNPTHFAVAMYYDGDIVPIPIVLAKGKDQVAHAMIACARELGIPVIRHVWLARTLYATARQDSLVPRSSYEAVAHVYAVVQQILMSNQAERVADVEIFGEPPPAQQG